MNTIYACENCRELQREINRLKIEIVSLRREHLMEIQVITQFVEAKDRLNKHGPAENISESQTLKYHYRDEAILQNMLQGYGALA